MAGRDQAMLAELDRLLPLAVQGVPTRRDLLDALPPLIAELRAAAHQPGMIGSATVLMRDLAIGLGVGELPDGSVEQLLARAERAQQLGRLDAAAASLRALPAGPARGCGLARWPCRPRGGGSGARTAATDRDAGNAR